MRFFNCAMVHCTFVTCENTCTGSKAKDFGISGGFPCDFALDAYRGAVEAGSLAASDTPRCLSEVGLVTMVASAPDRRFPVPPALVADIALTPVSGERARLREVERGIRASLSPFEALYHEAQRSSHPALTVIRGETAIRQALDSAVNACSRELITAQPGGGRTAQLLAEAAERARPVLERGVKQRTLYQHTVRHHAATRTYIEKMTATGGCEFRTLAEVFDRLIICDQEVAFIPISSETASTALAIRSSEVIRYLTIVFERSWVRAQPIGEASPVGSRAVVVDDLQRTILRAVVSGETDERVARRLGMSRRSVIEHIRKVAEQLGSNSRAQLGYMLAESGILQDPADPRAGHGRYPD
ncbi:LuxR C-terminal-related transcriptional regulator [Kitasatospora sp. NPDC088783]|uniref:LuxR C-terminal-related transcriptional regulator n=1 Tax=Kitasatospora sp. NPDC088783 TaxID=3364077 RepID=UPI003809CDB5